MIGYLDVREFATSTLNATNPAWLRLSQNPHTGHALCKATNVVYRTDTVSARDFLGQFVALP